MIFFFKYCFFLCVEKLEFLEIYWRNWNFLGKLAKQNGLFNEKSNSLTAKAKMLNINPTIAFIFFVCTGTVLFVTRSLL